LKKCIPTTRSGRAAAFAISVIGSVEVFEAKTASGAATASHSFRTACLTAAEWLGKSAIMGALRLYLDFINMFMFLLQFMGNRE
jgi:FtsH-binding integral membrane protein